MNMFTQAWTPVKKSKICSECNKEFTEGTEGYNFIVETNICHYCYASNCAGQNQDNTFSVVEPIEVTQVETRVPISDSLHAVTNIETLPASIETQPNFKEDPEYLEFLEWKKQKEIITPEKVLIEEDNSSVTITQEELIENVVEEIIEEEAKKGDTIIETVDKQSDEDKYNTMMDNLRNFCSGNASSESALTYGIPKKSKDGDPFIAHIFGGPYDLWVCDYNPEERTFFGYASFGGINDYDAEYGSVSLDELKSIGLIERDFYWEPKTLDELEGKNELLPENNGHDIILPDSQGEPTLVATQKFIDIDTSEEVSYTAQQAIDIADAPFNKAEQELPNIPVYQKFEVKEHITDIDERRKLNALCIVETINNNIEMGLENLYNSYSGSGKLHNVEFNGNFHDYTKAKQEFELGQFYTPDWLCKDIIQLCRIPNNDLGVMDMTCGIGRFFNYIEGEKRLYGFDVDDTAVSIAQSLFPYSNNISKRDLSLRPASRLYNKMGYNVGNPPFNLLFPGNWDHSLSSKGDEEEGNGGNLLSQNAYVYNTNYYLNDGGVSVFIAPQTWLSNTLPNKKVLEFVNNNFYYIADINLSNNTFSEYQVSFPTKVLVMMKKIPGVNYPMGKATFNSFEEWYQSPHANWFYENKKYIDQSNARIKLESIKFDANLNTEFKLTKDKYLKLKYEFQRQNEFGDFSSFDSKYNEILNRYNVAGKIDDLKELIKQIKKKIKNKDKSGLFIKVGLHNHKVYIKRSNASVTEYLNGLSLDKYFEREFKKNDIIINENKYLHFFYLVNVLKSRRHSMMYKGKYEDIKIIFDIDIKKFFDKKIKEYQLGQIYNSDLPEKFPIEYEKNFEMLSDIEYDIGDKTIKLLPHQIEDLSCVLMKRYALISWDTGLGKTLGGITWANIKGGKTLIVAPSMNLKDPWEQQLKMYVPNKSIFLLKKSKDIHKYNGEDFLIMSFETLPNIQRQIKKLKFRNLIVDESDNIKSKSSVRFKVLRFIAGKIKNKIMMTGTPTRNNVVEIYNQLELLANNSFNMTCFADYIIEYDRYSKEYEETKNKDYMQPFPAWGGHKLFEKCFSPKKLTCFGASETSQDIYNKDIFDDLVKKFRYTREFDIEKPRINSILDIEDTGIYKEYKQVIVPMSYDENKVYEYILDEFVRIVEEHYRQIHDGATASKLVIMRQIMALMQGTSHPWTFKEDLIREKDYIISSEISSKINKSIEIITNAFAEGKKVMVSSPWRDTADKMEETFIANGFKTFRIESEMSKNKRASIVSEFKHYNGPAIITGTMGCLKSGLNLPEVSVVIAESFPWNYAQLHQYAARAIRLNSTEKTDIYCLCSEGSFDLNVFSLLLRKEVQNTFVRKSEEVDISELTKDFGQESDIFESAMKMVQEKIGGKTRGTIKWTEKAVME